MVQRIELACLPEMVNPAYFLQVDDSPSLGYKRLHQGAFCMQFTDRVTQLAVSAILVLLIVVPSTVLLTFRKPSLAWLVWTAVSLWAALDSVQLTMLAFPERHSPKRALVVIMIAVANMVLSLGLALLPTAWINSLP